MIRNRVRIIFLQSLGVLFLFNLSASADPIAGISAQNFDEAEAITYPGEGPNRDIYRGGAPSVEDLSILADHGIKTIVDFRTVDLEYEKDEANRLGMRYINIPWKPHWIFAAFYNYSDISEKFLKIMDDPSNRPIYIHCQHGRDRTGTMIAIYRIRKEGWSLMQALEEMDHYGFKRYAFPNLVNFISRYYRKT